MPVSWKRAFSLDYRGHRSNKGYQQQGHNMNNSAQQYTAVPQHLTPEAVASLPPPGLSGPSHLQFSPHHDSGRLYLSYVSNNNNTTLQSSSTSTPTSPSTSRSNSVKMAASPLTTVGIGVATASSPSASGPSLYRPLTAQSSSNKIVSSSPAMEHHHHNERQLMVLDLSDFHRTVPPPRPVLSNVGQSNANDQTKRRIAEDDHSSNSNGGKAAATTVTVKPKNMTQLSWTYHSNDLRLLLPSRGNIWVQPQLQDNEPHNDGVLLLHGHGAASDAQFSHNGKLVAFVLQGDIYVQDALGARPATRVTFAPPPPPPPPDQQLETLVKPPSPPPAAAQQHDMYDSQHGGKSHGKVSSSSISSGSSHRTIRHGVADFVAQEEMDRSVGFWWHPHGCGLVFVQVDESRVPLVRMQHFDPSESNLSHEDHRYPFAGKENPRLRLGFLRVDEDRLTNTNASPIRDSSHGRNEIVDMEVDFESSTSIENVANRIARQNWDNCVWIDPPREAPEYLARVHWVDPDSSDCQHGSSSDACCCIAQWQNRSQTVSVWTRHEWRSPKPFRTLLVERSDVWINLHHNFTVLQRAIHPSDCGGPLERSHVQLPRPLPAEAFSFITSSERSGFMHLYLYTFCPNVHGDQAVLLRTLSAGEWIVESVVGVDIDEDVVYFTGTFDSPLERHLYALPLTCRRQRDRSTIILPSQSTSASTSHYVSSEESLNGSNGVRRGLSKVMHAFGSGTKHQRDRASESTKSQTWSATQPMRLTHESGMHTVVMDEDCVVFCDTNSDLDRPTIVKIYELPRNLLDLNRSKARQYVRQVFTLYDAAHDDNAMLDAPLSINGINNRLQHALPAPEIISFPTADGTETLHAALYRPDSNAYGAGPYPLVCAVYGGPHVQRVNRSWAQCADMRAQRLRNLGFCVVKCDNRGSSRRGLAFESAIARRLGRVEVLDQVAAIRHLTLRGIGDPARVGIYGWSYGGYLAAMCLCRAPDVFHVAVAGAPVTSWDGYDTHYTERYMGLPSDNPSGYRESAVFDHVPNMRGRLMIVHGLIDENVHFRHTARLINKLVAAGKDYDLMLFPDERHSPRRLRDRIYMERRIGDYFLRYLSPPQIAHDLVTTSGQNGSVQTFRNLAGHL